jgi:hypothetical protein
MLILLGAALFAFGLLLFGVGVTIYLIGLILRVAIRLFQLVLLLVWAGVAVCSWLRQRRKVTVLEGDILPPERRALSDRSHVRRLLLAAMIVLAASMAHADDWQQRAKAAAATSENDHQPCVLYVDRQDSRLHLRAPICFYNNGDIYSGSVDGFLSFNGRKAGATHPAVPCAETIEDVERVDRTTFLVRLYCKGATPEREAVSVQLIGDMISIRNTEAY